MENRSDRQSTTLTSLGILIVGFSIGWLVGLSASPVLAIVLASVVGVSGAVVATLSGVKYLDDRDTKPSRSKLPWQINPWPLAIIVIGIFLGSIPGILARNQGWLGSDLSIEVRKWEGQGLSHEQIVSRLFDHDYPYSAYSQAPAWLVSGSTIPVTATLAAEVQVWTNFGLSQEEVARRLFAIKYPLVERATVAASAGASTPQGTILFTVSTEECGRLLGTPNAGLRDMMSISGISLLELLAETIEDDTVLGEVVQALCKPS